MNSVVYSSVDAPFHEFCTSCRRHVGHIATGSTCQAPNNSAEQQGAHPSRTAPVVLCSNEQQDVKSQCRTFPDGRSNHYFTLRFAIISNHVVLLLPQEGHAHRLGTSWHVGPHDRPCSPADRSIGKITSFLPYFLYIGLHGMHVVLGWGLTSYICDEQYSSLLKNVYFCTIVLPPAWFISPLCSLC